MGPVLGQSANSDEYESKSNIYPRKRIQPRIDSLMSASITNKNKSAKHTNLTQDEMQKIECLLNCNK